MIFKNVIAGGQLTLHRYRMFRQVLRNMTFMAMLISLPYIVFQFSKVPYGHWYSLGYSYLVEFHEFVGSKKEISVDRKFWGWATKFTPSKDPLFPLERLKTVCKRKNDIFWKKAVKIFEETASVFSWTFFLSGAFFLGAGKVLTRKKHLSGKRICPAWLLALKLKVTMKGSKITIGKLPLIKGTENQHILVSGGTGSGKTNCFHHILPSLRESKQRAVVVDTTGVLVSRYYREGKDILLNPFDPRGKDWHPWVECRNDIDFESLAQSFIPASYNEFENYWRRSACDVFSSVLKKQQYEKRTQELTEMLLRSSLKELCDYVAETDGAAHLDHSSEKTAATIRSVGSSFLSCLKHIEDTNKPFSIREWVEKDCDDSWLFINCSVGERAALNPLISSWTSIAIRSLIQMPPDIDRRMWFVVDELPSLQKLKDLEVLLAEGRKFGACALLSLQSPAQLEAIYGHNITKVILGNCATRISFFEQDPEIAAQISKIFGEYEYLEMQEGLSYGANDMRDGINLSKQERRKSVVSASDIQSLRKQEAFVKLPEKNPITKLRLKLAKNSL